MVRMWSEWCILMVRMWSECRFLMVRMSYFNGQNVVSQHEDKRKVRCSMERNMKTRSAIFKIRIVFD